MASKSHVDQVALAERVEARRKEAEARGVKDVGDHIDAYLARCMAPWQKAIEGWGRAIEDLRTKAAALEQKKSGLREDYLKELIKVIAKNVDDRVVEMCTPVVEKMKTVSDRLGMLEKSGGGGFRYRQIWSGTKATSLATLSRLGAVYGPVFARRRSAPERRRIVVGD